MRKFILYVMLFVSTWFAIALYIDKRLTTSIRNSQVREYKIWEDIFHSRISADMIVLGSSRAYAHYNPAVFDSLLNIDFYNLGLNGKLSDMDIFRYHQYKKYGNHSPSFVIWDMMPTSFEYSEAYGDEQFMGYVTNSEMWEEVKRHKKSVTIFDRYVPLLRYWRRDMIHSYPHAVMDVYKGYRKEYEPFDASELRKTEDNSLQCSYNPEIISAVEKTIEEMYNDGARVIIVFSPLYHEGQAKYADIDVFSDTLQNIANRNGCIYLNYLDSSICTDSTLFKNAMHLNSKGADIFSALLIENIIQLIETTNVTKDARP